MPGKDFLPLAVACLGFCAIAHGQTTVTDAVPLKATVVNGITSSVSVIDNRSTIIRANTTHTFYATGTGTWSAQVQYSDTAATGPWTNFSNSGSVVSQSSLSPVGNGIGYHAYIRFLISGTTNVSYRGTKDVYIPPQNNNTGSVVSVSGPSWLTWTNPTTTPTATPTTGQTSHQVIGTCNTATTFAPCTLVVGDIPSLASLYLSLGGGTLSGPVSLPASGCTTGCYALSGTSSIDFGSTLDMTCAVSTFTLTGAATTDFVYPLIPAGIADGVTVNIFVSAANTVKVKLCNYSGSAYDPAALTFGARIGR